MGLPLVHTLLTSTYIRSENTATLVHIMNAITPVVAQPPPVRSHSHYYPDGNLVLRVRIFECLAETDNIQAAY